MEHWHPRRGTVAERIAVQATGPFAVKLRPGNSAPARTNRPHLWICGPRILRPTSLDLLPVGRPPIPNDNGRHDPTAHRLNHVLGGRRVPIQPSIVAAAERSSRSRCQGASVAVLSPTNPNRWSGARLFHGPWPSGATAYGGFPNREWRGRFVN